LNIFLFYNQRRAVHKTDNPFITNKEWRPHCKGAKNEKLRNKTIQNFLLAYFTANTAFDMEDKILKHLFRKLEALDFYLTLKAS
jgi:hypothetical protein